MKVENNNRNRKPLIYYCIITMIITLLLNAFLFPRILEAQVTEVTYNDFLDKLDAGKVDEVAIDDSQIIFTAQGDNGNLAIYKTGRMPDDDLVTRLRAAKGLNGSVQFASEIPTQQSPILSFLISWVFPILLFTALGSFMVKRMGGAAGNAMQFGKSNAKIYIESQTGKTFADVEGEDEAKDALREVVDFLHNPISTPKSAPRCPKACCS